LTVAVEVTHLRKAYGDTVAVDDVSFGVAEAEIFGLLGPNGAGKTSTVECVLGMRERDGGSIRVLGHDPARDGETLHAVVGAQLQASALPAKLTAGEIVGLYSSFYREPEDVETLLDVLGLAAKRRARYQALSGGQKQRLSLLLALIGRPRVAVLDEMTTGLDPNARRATWDLLEGVRARGVTVLLVTHQMDEAERLCDRVALIDRGRLVAVDSPAGLAAAAGGGKRVVFEPSVAFDDALLTALPEVRGVEGRGPHVVVSGSGDLVNAVILTLAAAGVAAHDVRLETATLDDAFVQLTGRRLREDEEPAEP